MTEAQARDVDALADALADRVTAGELTTEQAGALAAQTAIRDAHAVLRARQRPPPSAPTPAPPGGAERPEPGQGDSRARKRRKTSEV